MSNLTWVDKSSARSSTKQRAKAEKAITAASKKSRKLAKANPQNRSKLKKDPGIPNLFPFKKEMIQEIEQSRHNLEVEKKKRRDLAAQLNQHQRHRNALKMEVEESGMARLAQIAADKEREFEDMMTDGTDFDVEQSTKNDTSRKAYNKEFKKVIEQADFILYVLDARDPEGTRSREVESLIRESPNGEKQILLVLNKIG